MPCYDIPDRRLHLGGRAFHVCSLGVLRQFADHDHRGTRCGMPCAQWSLLGLIKPAVQMVARAVAQQDIADKCTLRLDCRFGLSSLLPRWRCADLVPL